MKEADNISQIIEKYVKGDCNREDLQLVKLILEDKKYEQELVTTLSAKWDQDSFDNKAPKSLREPGKILEVIHKNIGQRSLPSKGKRIKRYIDTVSKIAAILLIGFIVGWLVQTIKTPDITYYTSIAPEGSISQVLLPDSSLVVLNSGSEIRYSIDGEKGQREVFLNGEGWFEIKKDKNKPFVVHTSFYDVNVTGTEFNVKAYVDDNEVQTTLESGSVVVSSSGKYRMLDQELKPGEQLVFNKKEKKISLKKVNTKLFTSWKDNKLIFLDMKLNELFVLLERKYGVDIKVNNESILDYHYFGTIRDETILEVLDILTHSLPIEYEIIGQEVIINKERKNMK